MTISVAICYLDTDGKVVGIKYETGTFKVNEGTVTETILPYPYTRVFPIEFLVADGDPLTIRVLTQEEVSFVALVEEGEITRDKFISSPINVHGAIWKMYSKDRDNIQDGLDEAVMYGLPDDYQQHWIMADGSIFPATPLKLKQVLAAYRTRKQDTYNQYIAWLSSSPTEDFEEPVDIAYTFGE